MWDDLLGEQRQFGKLSAVLIGLLAVAVVGTVLFTQSLFGWTDSANPAPKPSTTAHLKVIDAASLGPLPAQQVVRQVLRTEPDGLGSAPWHGTPMSLTVPSITLGFGCDPKAPAAPVAAATRAWSRTATHVSSPGDLTGPEAVSVSVRAYSAGGGALAYQRMLDAANACSSATVNTSPPGAISTLGVEADAITTSGSTLVLWRRGDVMVTASVGSAVPGGVGGLQNAFQSIDTRLQSALQNVCAEQYSMANDSRRSPYLDRRGFIGKQVVLTTKARDLPKPGPMPAGVKPVHIPGPYVYVPAEPALPQVPNPPVTRGPVALPAYQSQPVAPQAPQRPPKFVNVKKQVDDPTGPGCGWSFTGQIQPPFNAALAEQNYRDAEAGAQSALRADWQWWWGAKIDYFRAFAAFRQQALAYQTYTSQVASVAAAWQIVNDARAQYQSALNAWNAAQSALSNWTAQRPIAQMQYQQAQTKCQQQAQQLAQQQQQQQQQQPKNKKNKKKQQQQQQPQYGPCPPPRPAILDQPAPSVPPSPTPAPEAQLPPGY